MLNQELVHAVKKLITNGTSYNVSNLDNIYHEDLRIAGGIRIFGRGQNNLYNIQPNGIKRQLPRLFITSDNAR